MIGKGSIGKILGFSVVVRIGRVVKFCNFLASFLPKLLFIVMLNNDRGVAMGSCLGGGPIETLNISGSIEEQVNFSWIDGPPAIHATSRFLIPFKVMDIDITIMTGIGKE